MTDDWNGRRVTEARAWVIARDDGICQLCEHTGANSLDHVVPRSTAPDLTWQPSNWVAVHLTTAGTDRGCPHPDCACTGNIGRKNIPFHVIRAVINDARCTCPCSCGARTSTTLAAADPDTDWRTRGPASVRPPTPTLLRLAQEEANYSEAEAARAATAWRQGERSEWACTGYNVHLRRYQRARRGAPASREW